MKNYSFTLKSILLVVAFGELPWGHSWADTPPFLEDPICSDSPTAETLNPKQAGQIEALEKEISRSIRVRSKLGPFKGASLKEINVFYGLNPVVQKTMAAAHEGSKVHRDKSRQTVGSKESDRALGRCYMYTQMFAKKGGLTQDNRWVDETGVSAKNAGPALKRRGFVNLMELPEYRKDLIKDGKVQNIPLGALLVYDAFEGSPFGHIEIKTNRGFVSDYASVGMRTRTAADKKAGIEGSVKARGRTLIGVYIKPALIEEQL